VNVLKHHRITLDSSFDQEGRNKHVQRLVELKHWAHPLAMDGNRTTFHVLEAVDAAAAILDYARANRVDHIGMGARTSSFKRSILGSVSQAVVAGADCTVTVVRPPRSLEAAETIAPADPPF
jgi:nucleotide-binding universal stress UspA family protein